MTNPTFTFEDPPAPARGNSAGKYVEMLDTLRQHPGQWVKLGERRYTSFSNAVKQGALTGASKGEFDAVSRNVEDGKGDIYIRFIGK